MRHKGKAMTDQTNPRQEVHEFVGERTNEELDAKVHEFVVRAQEELDAYMEELGSSAAEVDPIISYVKRRTREIINLLVKEDPRVSQYILHAALFNIITYELKYRREQGEASTTTPIGQLRLI